MLEDKIRPVDPDYDVGPKRKRKKAQPYHQLGLKFLPIAAMILATWAMLNLQPEVTGAALFKAALVGLVVGSVSYCINRFAIDWGTELFAAGYITAGVFSILSMMLVAGCLWLFSFGGIVLPDVRLLRFEDHGLALSKSLSARQEEASKALRIVPVIQAAKDDLAFHAACERREGCISGRGGGAGTLSRSLDERAARAGAISEQLAAGTQTLSQTVMQANEILANYQKILNDDSQSLRVRRQRLIELDGAFGQAIAGLNEAVPTSLLAAYAQELNSGIAIPNRAEATLKVNALLRKHGQAIQSVLGSIETEAIIQPSFPGKAGLSDTLDYIGNFAPLAGVIWVAEGIFPLALWIYTLLFLIRQRDRQSPVAAAPSPSALLDADEQVNHHNIVELPADRDLHSTDIKPELLSETVGSSTVVSSSSNGNRKVRRRRAKLDATSPNGQLKTGADPGQLNGSMSAQNGEAE